MELPLGTSDELVERLMNWGLGDAAQEEMWVIALDASNNVRGVSIAARGGYAECYVEIPTLFTPVLLSATDRFVIAHNHPNNDPTPTADDYELTRRVEQAAGVMGMAFDDHIIVCPNRTWHSLHERGEMA